MHKYLYMKDIKEYNINNINNTKSTLKPKNWGRKMYICNCDIPVFGSQVQQICSFSSSFKINIKYQVKFIKPKFMWFNSNKIISKEITNIELPKMFNSLDKSEFTIFLGSFTRGGEEIPCPSYIGFNNVEKYDRLWRNEQRKEKLKKLKNAQKRRRNNL